MNDIYTLCAIHRLFARISFHSVLSIAFNSLICLACICYKYQVNLPEQILFAFLRPILYVLDEHRPQYYDP